MTYINIDSKNIQIISRQFLSLNQLPIILMSDAYRPDRHAAPPVSGIAFAEAKNEYNIAKGKNLKGMDENALARVRNEKLGFVFQDFMLLDGLTVRENILVPRIIQEKVESDAEELADKLLALFGIASVADKYPADISGGEKQRTAVARSLINRPLLILADEPTGNLDSKSSRTVIESFEEARSSLGASVFMVTHDSFAASFCDRVILLKDGMVYDTLEAEPGHREDGRGVFQDRLLGAIREMSRMDSEISGRISPHRLSGSDMPDSSFPPTKETGRDVK